MRQFIIGSALLAATVLSAVLATGLIASNGPVWP
jgi:hypothetical protein